MAEFIASRAQCTLQIDVGFGDAVTPAPQTVAYPTLLDDLLWPPTEVASAKSPATATWRPESLCGV